MGSITDPERLYLSLPVISAWKGNFIHQKLDLARVKVERWR